MYHLADFGTAGAGATSGGAGFDPLAWVKSAGKSAIDKLTGGWFDSLKRMGVVGELGIGFAKKAISGIFDNGGLLQPGLNLAYNGTGTTEPVLTSGQWSDVRAASVNPASAARGGGTTEVHLHLSGFAVGTERQMVKQLKEAFAGTDGTGLKFA